MCACLQQPPIPVYVCPVQDFSSPSWPVPQFLPRLRGQGVVLGFLSIQCLLCGCNCLIKKINLYSSNDYLVGSVWERVGQPGGRNVRVRSPGYPAQYTLENRAVIGCKVTCIGRFSLICMNNEKWVSLHTRTFSSYMMSPIPSTYAIKMFWFFAILYGRKKVNIWLGDGTSRNDVSPYECSGTPGP